MRRGRAICGAAVALTLLVSFDSFLPRSPVGLKRVGRLVSADRDLARLSSSVDLRRNGELLIAGRALRCGRTRNVLDPDLRTEDHTSELQSVLHLVFRPLIENYMMT